MFFDDPEQVCSFLHQCILTSEEFVALLSACTPSLEDGQQCERVAATNQAILWVFYDTGIRASELTNLRLGDFDRADGLITVKEYGAKRRRIALGQHCLHHLCSYVDDYRLSETELSERGNSGEDHVFLSETGQPLTKPDITALLVALKQRAGLVGKCLHPSTFRDTFAVRYLELSHDAASLQVLLGEEDMTVIKGYVQLSTVSSQGMTCNDFLNSDSLFLPVSRIPRRRAFRAKEVEKENT